MWIKKEAIKLLERKKDKLTFATGYGPSGLPHIGTFGEVFRTNCVIKAVNQLDEKIKTLLLVVSDDMDALRKVPDNIPNKEILIENLDKPLTSIPDPFGKHLSYADGMNHRFMSFLDLFGFKYEFKSSTECYKSGIYDDYLLMILDKYEKIMEIMLPTLGEERKESYSPFLPICPDTGKVLQVKITAVDKKNGSIIYKQENSGKLIETPVTRGMCKLQWKPDWGMRWAALGIDYEMHGKDLTPSAIVSSKICKTIGFDVPHLFTYEMFLDEEWKKISKSKGNGISLYNWLKYGPLESLALYLIQNPQRAKKLYFGSIPKSVDDFLLLIKNDAEQDLENPIFYIERKDNYDTHDINYSLLLNLAKACNPENKEIMWNFIRNYSPDLTPKKNKFLDKLVEFSVNYYHDFVKPKKVYRNPNSKEVEVLKELYIDLCNLRKQKDLIKSDVQNVVYRIAKHHYENIKDCFNMLYQVLLGSEDGPRIGSFFMFYGLENSLKLIQKATDRV